MNSVKSSNIITGTTGAFLGSLIGVALWMLIYHFGYIASIAGLVIIICAMKGYEILSGALDKKGVIIVGIVSIVMVFVANHLSWTMDVYIELKDLGLEYFLTIIGGASTLFGNFRRA